MVGAADARLFEAELATRGLELDGIDQPTTLVTLVPPGILGEGGGAVT